MRPDERKFREIVWCVLKTIVRAFRKRPQRLCQESPYPSFLCPNSKVLALPQLPLLHIVTVFSCSKYVSRFTLVWRGALGDDTSSKLKFAYCSCQFSSLPIVSLQVFPQPMAIAVIRYRYGPGLEKSRLKLNLCQPVAFINLSRFKPAFINKSRLKFRINEITENHSSKE